MTSQTLYQLAKRYGKALFSAASTPVMRQHFWEDWVRLQSVLSNDPAGWRILLGPRVSQDQKTKILMALSENLSLRPLMKGFLKTLVKYGRLRALTAIMERFQKEIHTLSGKKYGSLITAAQMSRAQIQKTEMFLTEKMGYDIVLTHQVDPSLLGGAILSWSGFRIDGSLATTLDLLSQRLQKGM